jgi:DNA-directed RNA polymerase sigma subunit (sigma70/sigma32)
MNQPSPRYEQVWNLRQHGLTLKAIGIIMSLSPERIRQMVFKWNRWLKAHDEE